jgi:hypothetical protein
MISYRTSEGNIPLDIYWIFHLYNERMIEIYFTRRYVYEKMKIVEIIIDLHSIILNIIRAFLNSLKI